MMLKDAAWFKRNQKLTIRASLIPDSCCHLSVAGFVEVTVPKSFGACKRKVIPIAI